MTVGAVIIVDADEDAIADAAGRPAVRRIIETAWAGGATPIVVVAADADGSVSAALAGSGAILVRRAAGDDADPLDEGAQIARDRVAGTAALLAWPVTMTWVDAETVTSLIQAHGLAPLLVQRPRWDGTPGWPVLLPLEALDEPDAATGGTSRRSPWADRLASSALATRTLDLGDPGSVLDRTTPMDALPPYAGPAEPLEPPPEWGSAAADLADETPVPGPQIATPRDPDATRPRVP